MRADTVDAEEAPPPPLRVALNLVFLNPRSGGVGRYARELIPAMLGVEPATRLTAFVGRELPEDVRGAPWASALKWVTLPVQTNGGPPGTFALATAAQWLAIPAIAARRGVDVVHGLANVAPLWMPRAARVVTLLDLIWMRYPNALEPAALSGMRRVAIPSVRRADRVITISEAARSDIVAGLDLPASRIDVTPLGADTSVQPASITPPEELRAKLDVGTAELIVAVSAGRVHKNLPALVEAFALMRDRDCLLVISGDLGALQPELAELARARGVAERLRTPGWLQAADHEGLFAAATCFVMPSLMEGFGLPVIEAMQRRVAVACSETSSVGEVAGDAAELFDPLSPGDIARALDRLIEDPARREQLVALGTQRAARFTWEQTARATLGSYRRAIGGRR
jgi:glycosyltransferase involved in cell wall biosynthesis